MGTDALRAELAVYEARVAAAEDAAHPDPVAAERYRERAAAVRLLLGEGPGKVEARPAPAGRAQKVRRGDG